LIVNADDFGLSKAVNDGIGRAHADGIVTSASLLANMSGFDHAVKLARRTPTLGVGLHVNLTYGKPLAPANAVSSLVGAEGHFSDKRSEWLEEHVEREMELQLAKLLAAGLHPTHLDSHHHIHIEVPSVYAAMKKLAKRLGIPIRLHPWAADGEDGPLRTDRLMMDTFDDGGGVSRLLGHISALQEGTTEIMCHPGLPDRDGPGGSKESGKRIAELEALLDSRVKDALREHGVRLIHFGQLAAAASAAPEIRVSPPPDEAAPLPAAETDGPGLDCDAQGQAGRRKPARPKRLRKKRFRSPRRAGAKKRKPSRRLRRGGRRIRP
jgi:predicted glycoside hydrolase/deacetylase ChbG (UPF0249 family)